AALREKSPCFCRWYKLRSKPGKKEKERGEIEVDIQFMRSNMTASMFDLSMKDKSRSPFGKLKDKLKGKRSSGLSDTASAIVPSSAHSSADSEDESLEKEKKKSKFKKLFSKPGLQKSSLSQSMSVLPTQQPVTERVRLRPSDFQSQWDDEESESSPTSEKKSSLSPVFKSRKTVTLDRQLHPVTGNHTKKEGLSLFSGLKSKSDPISKSSLCINGSHVYMEESTTKDNTPASSPSPHNFRRKQLFASEENLSSRSTRGPEETGRTSPSHAFSGSASLETFKSMTLPSYKLLSSEEHLETSVPPSVEVIKEPKKTDHKKSTLLSLVTGKKEAAKTSDSENIPERTLQGEENKIPEEKSEQEAKHPELPADLGSGNPPEGSHRAEDDVSAPKQPLNPFEEEQKPEKAAAPAKTKAVKPRLGVSSEEESKATLPTFAPDSLPAFLPAPRSGSDNNPFIPKTGRRAQAPDPDDVTGSPASLAAPPPFAAELFTGGNPFTPQWGRAPSALDARGVAGFPASHHLAASLPRQVPGSTNNPFAPEWRQSSWGQGPESSGSQASRDPSHPPSPSLPSSCRFNDNNPFGSRLGWEAEAARSKAVVSSSPVELGRCDRRAVGSSSEVASTGDVRAPSNPLGAHSDSPGLVLKPQCQSPQLGVEASLESSELGRRDERKESEQEENQEIGGEKRWEEHAPTLEPQASDKKDSFSQAGPAKLPPGARSSSLPDADVLRAGREVPVAPKPAPCLAVAPKRCPPGSQAAEFGVDRPPWGDGVKPAPGPPLPAGKGSDAREHLPRSGSSEPLAPPVPLRDHSGSQRVKSEGDDELFDCLANLKSAVPLAGDRGLKLAGLPVIPEGGSDDELLGDGQEIHGLATDDQDISMTGKQSLGLIPLRGDLKGHSGSSAAAPVTPTARAGGSAGSAPGVCEPGEDGGSVRSPVAGSGSAVMPHSRERSSCSEKGELKTSSGVEEHAERDCLEPPVSSSSLSSPSQPRSSSPSLPSDAPSPRAESPKKPTAEGSADKAGNSGKKKLLQAWVSPSEAQPKLGLQGGETLSPKHRLHPVKPMNTTANKAPSKSLNVISTMNEKLLEMNMKKYDPSDPAYAYAQLTHDELIQLVLRQKDTITRKDLQVRELEDYIDNLLVRVMEETPNILRVSTSGNKKAGKM
ncbi:RFIP1 protein, partial [Baryphthengus martii]|nr:RFIP1 protein [Baryphthengus martii]